MEDLELKVGDLIRLRDDLEDGKIYNDFYFHNNIKFEGFKRILKEFGIGFYLENSQNYVYTKEMIAEVKRPIKYKTIYKIEEPILAYKEKEYLSNVIRPFKDEVNALVKMAILKRKYICIKLEKDCVYLPYFTKDTMYKNMELNTEYTLEELGL